LYNEGKMLIDRAQSAKHIDATFHSIDGVAHAWDKSPTGEMVNKRDAMYKDISNAIKRSWV
jgi:hypothetical protein